ncbi:PP2C family protein-serine/threonine phosphatase [Leptolyngbya sp. AN03gr2]|uniref:PP2C family protein-serine/threonine phosphatase n=1 Tax=unclassified Leptolyngbya TaxID=2650499 RepID=UPI003D315990
MKSPNYYARTETNQRENNEDCFNGFLIEDQGGQVPVLVIADGMGGHEHGEDVSRQAVLKVEDFLKKTIQQIAAQSDPVKYLKHCLLNAIASANELVQRMVSVNGWDRAGSTIVIAIVWQNKVIAANLGDSPLFHWSQKTGELDRVTQDHSVPGILAQAKLITEEMARYHERRGQLEFFLGSKTLPQPDPIYERTLEPGDLLLMCSDGISGSLSREQVRAILADSTIDLPDKAEQLIQAARDEGETDNQTVILWRYKVPSQTTSTLKLAAPTALQPRTQPTLIQSSVSAQSPSSPRSRRKRSISRKGLLILGAISITITISLVWLLFQALGALQAHRAGPNLQPAAQPIQQQPIQPKSVPKVQSFQGSVLTTIDENNQAIEWGNPKLKLGEKGCRSNIPEIVDRQDIVSQSAEQLITKSESTGCIRVWKPKLSQGISPQPTDQFIQSVEVPIVSIQGERA